MKHLIALVALSMSTSAFPAVIGLNVAQWDGKFDTAGQGFTKELGAQSLRLAYDHGDYNFGVEWASRNGKSVLFMLGYGAGLDVETASGRQAYADRSATLAATYGTKVKYYEVWNEWNGGFGLGCEWGQAGTACVDAAMYTDLLCRTYKAIKAAQPTAIVIGGATAGVDTNFISGMLDAGAGNCMDMVSAHPYVFMETAYSVPANAPAYQGVTKFVQAITAIHNLVKTKTGKVMKVVVSEDGRTDGGNSANRQRVAAYLKQLYAKAQTISFLEGIWWYELEDVASHAQGHGLLSGNNVRKPAFYAYKALPKVSEAKGDLTQLKTLSALQRLLAAQRRYFGALNEKRHAQP